MDNKIPHQSADWIRDDKAGRPQRPSEVFLELWQTVTTLDSELPAEDFARYARSWREIDSLEEIYAEAKRQELTMAALESLSKDLTGQAEVKKDPSPVRSLVRDDRENVTASAMADNNAGGASPSPASPTEGGQTYDCASAPMPDPEEVARANRSAGGKAGFATRKRSLTERLEALRRDGRRLHEIAEAVPGLTINDVMDGLNAKTLTPRKIQALEKACRKLEEAQAGG